MITIEEKLKLFTKIIYDKVDRENLSLIEKFDKNFGNLLEKKKKELQSEARGILEISEKETEREGTRLLSRARIEEKKILRDKEKEIFERAVSDLLAYGSEYTKTSAYEESFIRDLEKLSPLFNEGGAEVYITEADSVRFGETIKNHFKNLKISFVIDNGLIGGFIISEPARGIKYDMSISGKIEDSREIIGNMLLNNLH